MDYIASKQRRYESVAFVGVANPQVDTVDSNLSTVFEYEKRRFEKVGRKSSHAPRVCSETQLPEGDAQRFGIVRV